MRNIGFIIDLNDPNLNEILEVCVQREDTMRRSLDGTQGFVKLPLGVTEIPGVLKSYKAYYPKDEAELEDILTSDKWSDNTIKEI